MILNAKFTKFGQLSANEVTRYNIPNYLAFSHWVKKSDDYPTFDTEDFKDKLTSDLETVPLLLRFLKTIITSKSHRDGRLISIIHSIVHANRPRSTLPSLQLGLAVQLHHTEGSRRIIEQLYRMGFCVSYTDVSVNRVMVCLS